MTEMSSFRTKRGRPGSLQLFGSNVSRFNEKPIGSSLGPGQYKVPNRIGIKNNSAVAKIGSAAFRSPERPEPIQMQNFELPGPGEYSNEEMNNPLGAKLKAKQN